MRPLNIVVNDRATISLQFFDYLYAYYQSQYNDNLIIKFSREILKDGSINICLVDKFDQDSLDRQVWEKFDLVLLENAGESLLDHNSDWPDLLRRHPNVFLLCGVVVTRYHNFFDKIICFNHNLVSFTDCVSRPFYPQHFRLKNRSITQVNAMVFINGQNRAWRQYFLDRLLETVGDKIKVRNTYNSTITKMLDCEFESCEDTQFRIWLNDNYACIDTQHQEQNLYYDNSVSVGIDNKFGLLTPGYFFLPEYFDHTCVIYPETSWINDSFLITEKTWKCFVSQAIPWPIGGANLHSMLNELGFMTARDLLPDNLKSFDSILDHEQRHTEQAKAIKWAVEQPEIWNSAKADSCRKINLIRFWHNDINQLGLQHFVMILNNV